MNRLIVLVLLLIAAIFLLPWYYFDGSFKDFGVNGFTDVLGILITVLIIDKLIKRQDRIRSLPQRATAYEDVRLLADRIIFFWSGLFSSHSLGAMPENYSELFREETFEKILKSLNSDLVPGTPRIPEGVSQKAYWAWASEILAEHKNHAEKILERYNNVLEPGTYRNVHKLVTKAPGSEVFTTFYKFFLEDHVEDYCKILLELIEWCKAQRKKLESEGVRNLKDVGGLVNWNYKQNRPSMIPHE